MYVHQGQKDSNPVFKECHLQANLVFLRRYLCFIAFLFLCVVYFIFEWKIKFITGLCYLGETGLPLTHLALNCDCVGFSDFISKRSGTTFLLFNVFVVWLVPFYQAWVDPITSSERGS